MATYVVLVSWTEKGIQQAGDTTKRAANAAQMAEALGGHMDHIFWTLGRYDLVGIVDLPSAEAMATLGLKLGALGTVRTESLRAFTSEEMDGILAGLA